MKMVSLARSPKEKIEQQKRYSEGTPADEMEDYPWGLTLRLSHEELQKLGMASMQIESGALYDLIGKAIVEGVTTKVVNGMKQNTIELQVTALALEPSTPEVPRSTALYGD